MPEPEAADPEPPTRITGMGRDAAGGTNPDGGRYLLGVLLALTLLSGLIDAVCYLGLGRVFTANMTGNVVVLGFAAAGAPGFSVPATLTSLAVFLVGAACASRIAGRFTHRSRKLSAAIAT